MIDETFSITATAMGIGSSFEYSCTSRSPPKRQGKSTESPFVYLPPCTVMFGSQTLYNWRRDENYRLMKKMKSSRRSADDEQENDSLGEHCLLINATSTDGGGRRQDMVIGPSFQKMAMSSAPFCYVRNLYHHLNESPEESKVASMHFRLWYR